MITREEFQAFLQRKTQQSARQQASVLRAWLGIIPGLRPAHCVANHLAPLLG